MFWLHIFGNTTVWTTQVQLLSSLPTSVKAEVDIRADSNNTGTIYVWLDGVTSSTGWILRAWEGKSININDPRAIYVIGSTSWQVISHDVNYI